MYSSYWAVKGENGKSFPLCNYLDFQPKGFNISKANYIIAPAPTQTPALAESKARPKFARPWLDGLHLNP